MTRDADLAAAVAAARERHDARHQPSPLAGYCREGRTLRAVRCDVGALLEALDRLQGATRR